MEELALAEFSVIGIVFSRILFLFPEGRVHVYAHARNNLVDLCYIGRIEG